MAKHKEVQRWSAGVEEWFGNIIVVQATLVESAKQWRLKEQKDGTLNATERQFSACEGHRKRWDKEFYTTVGCSTREAALRRYHDSLLRQVEQAERVLRTRNYAVDRMEEQMREESYKVLQ